MSDTPPALYRYGRREHINEAFRNGRFRISPASAYRDLQRDRERQDDELVRIQRSPSEAVIITIQETGQTLPTTGPLTYRSETGTDYYVLCLSSEGHNDHFHQFAGSDACLVIRDVAAFRERICEAFERVLPGWGAVDDAVNYGGPHQFGPAFAKPLEYFPQFEWRFAWRTLETPALQAIFVEAGSLEDIASVVDHPPGFTSSH